MLLLEVTAEFESLHNAYNKKNFASGQYNLEVTQIGRLVPTIGVSVIALLTGIIVVEGKLSLALFVVLLRTVSSFAPTLGAIYSNVFAIFRSYASIKKLAKLLNSETRRMMLLRGSKTRAMLIPDFKASPAGKEWADDRLLVNDLDYHYEGNMRRHLPRISCSVEPGQIVALVGSPSSGKALLLRLMGGSG